LKCLCGEKLVLLGRDQGCQEEGCTLFRRECGRELTPAEDRADERALAIGELLRRSIKAARSVQRHSTLPLTGTSDGFLSPLCCRGL
jgi:hypothetical protein